MNDGKSSSSIVEPALDTTLLLQKRAVPTVAEMEQKTGRNSDYYQTLALKNPGWKYNAANQWVPDKREKWSNRELILFNKDTEGARDLALYYEEKMNRLTDSDAQQKAKDNMDFWSERAQEWEQNGQEPLYSKHREELRTFLRDKVSKYDHLNMPNRRAKWLEQAHSLHVGNIENAKRKEITYHIKSIAAAQNKDDWLKHKPSRDDPYHKLSLESYSNPDKEALLQKLDPDFEPSQSQRVMGTTQGDLDMYLTYKDLRDYRETKVHQPLHLPQKGSATRKSRILSKLENSQNVNNNGKWRNRKFARDKSNEEFFYRDYEILHHHNKSIKKKWQQLRWASAAEHMKKANSGQSDSSLGVEGSSSAEY